MMYKYECTKSNVFLIAKRAEDMERIKWEEDLPMIFNNCKNM